MNGESYSCGNLRVKRVQNAPSVSFYPRRYKYVQHILPPTAGKTQSEAKRLFVAQCQNKTTSGFAVQNTHSVRRTSGHVCSSADKHMVDITEWLLSGRNQETGCWGSSWFLPLNPCFFSIAAGTQVHVTQYLSDT